MTRMPVFRRAESTADEFTPRPSYLPMVGTLRRFLRTDLASVTVTSHGHGLADERRMPPEPAALNAAILEHARVDKNRSWARSLARKGAGRSVPDEPTWHRTIRRMTRAAFPVISRV